MRNACSNSPHSPVSPLHCLRAPLTRASAAGSVFNPRPGSRFSSGPAAPPSSGFTARPGSRFSSGPAAPPSSGFSSQPGGSSGFSDRAPQSGFSDRAPQGFEGPPPTWSRFNELGRSNEFGPPSNDPRSKAAKYEDPYGKPKAFAAPTAHVQRMIGFGVAAPK